MERERDRWRERERERERQRERRVCVVAMTCHRGRYPRALCGWSCMLRDIASLLLTGCWNLLLHKHILNFEVFLYDKLISCPTHWRGIVVFVFVLSDHGSHSKIGFFSNLNSNPSWVFTGCSNSLLSECHGSSCASTVSFGTWVLNLALTRCLACLSVYHPSVALLVREQAVTMSHAYCPCASSTNLSIPSAPHAPYFA